MCVLTTLRGYYYRKKKQNLWKNEEIEMKWIVITKKKRNCLYFPMILKSMKLKGLLLIDGPNPFHSNSFQWSFTSCLLLLMVVGWKDAKGLGIPFCQTKSRILSRSSSWMGNAWVKAKTKVITRRIFMSDWVLDHTLRCFLSTFIL